MAARRPSTRNRDILVATDSEDDTPLVISSRPVPRSSSKRKKHPTPEPELIEILSSDEEILPRKRQAVATVPPRDQLKQSQQEIRNLKAKLEKSEARREKSEAKLQKSEATLQKSEAKLEKVEGELEQANGELRLASKRSGKVVLDAAQLEEHISCEICTSTMWKPFILSGCGHTFCAGCLVEWFGTTLAQHMTANPAWRSTNQPPYHLVNPRIRANPYIAAMIAQQGPQPEYTCPTCRSPVLTKPVEDFSLKAIIHDAATSAGESSPKDPVVAKRRGKAKAKAVGGPFDGFFGKET
ncbi:hypothetical protein B0H17DRAFT_1064292 [Mycena rosella]|uniref:E3 ubiquitin protein ligase n=1 Tax=Mycena rosella TaxID=1033263 RepID=A0AAD7DFQ7_MYCRO|nr:hypothetical protein B0H17DRAFT_1064292 [Mycena rosella]